MKGREMKVFGSFINDSDKRWPDHKRCNTCDCWYGPDPNSTIDYGPCIALPPNLQRLPYLTAPDQFCYMWIERGT